MKLTEREQCERAYLQDLQKSRIIPMMQTDYDRLCELNMKEAHNNCSNPRCTGYEGTNGETHCPKCNFKLVKSI